MVLSLYTHQPPPNSQYPAQLSQTQDDYIRQFLDGRPDGPIGFHYPATPAFERWLEMHTPHGAAA